MNIRKALKRSAFVFLYTFAVFAVIWTSVLLVANHRYQKADARWKEVTGQSLKEFRKTHLENKENQTARMVDKLARKIINLEEDDVFSFSEDLLYLKDQLEKNAQEIDPPTAQVTAFLSKQSENLEELRFLVTLSPSPVWRNYQIESRDINAVIALNKIQTLLAADALSELQQGDNNKAVANMKTGWCLAEATDNRAYLIFKLCALINYRKWIGVLRKYPNAPDSWILKLHDFNLKKQISEGIEAEACYGWQQVKYSDYSNLFREKAALIDQWKFFLRKPYTQLCCTNYLLLLANQVDTFSHEAPCTGDLKAIHDDLLKKNPKWDIDTGDAIGSTFTQYEMREWKLKLDMELTAKILEATAARAENGGKWPESIPGIEECKSCQDARFEYSVSNGKMTLEYRGMVPDLKSKGVRLPLRYVESE